MAGFRDARRDIPDQPAPDLHDEENMNARPGKEEMEHAINNSCSGSRLGSKRKRVST